MFKIIAETAFSHEGNFNYLLEQIKTAKEGKADYIKFQVFLNKDDYIVKSHPSYNLLDKWMFNEEQWKEAFQLAKSLKLKILVLPLNVSSAKFCLKQDFIIDMYEVHSVCFNDVLLLETLSSASKKIILGVGGRLPQEVEFAKKVLNKKKDEIILIYGFQSFPTNKLMLNLNKIKSFKAMFNCELGYADHSSYENNDFFELNTISYLLGARYFEKHIVKIKGEKRIDFESAISVDEFIEMRNKLENLENVLGNGNAFSLNSKEIQYKSREKQIVAKRFLNKNEEIKKEDLTYKITETTSDFEQDSFYNIVGKLSKGIEVDTAIKYNDIK